MLGRKLQITYEEDPHEHRTRGCWTRPCELSGAPARARRSYTLSHQAWLIDSQSSD